MVLAFLGQRPSVKCDCSNRLLYPLIAKDAGCEWMEAEGSSCSLPGVLSPASSSFLLPTVFSRLSWLFYVILTHINDLLIAISCTREGYGGDTLSS